jgi:hypothetical protein
VVAPLADLFAEMSSAGAETAAGTVVGPELGEPVAGLDFVSANSLGDSSIDSSGNQEGIDLGNSMEVEEIQNHSPSG